ncbi:Flp/Fap pilin component [Desulfonatronum thiosulfatophilum]|uniref:Flp/Fap pilin component n=1 Tax=Desulfonatronum thiosulfatophilum TaxID=617002 RepID=A0A1G6C8C8_9BACT|nr:Flp family type IVb pilin [Desulfonatronum thiosulfatophilum]SDB29127.1 Flp/Fap pilin component [Desulfonatronum thiosulfatophilum]
MEKLMNFLKDEEGAGFTEYALLIAFVALIVVFGATYFGGKLGDFFADVGDAFDNPGAKLPPWTEPTHGVN